MAYDNRNFGQVIGDAGESFGRALMTLNSMMEGRIERAHTLARQGRLDSVAAQRLINDGKLLEMEVENAERVKREGADKRARQVDEDRQAQADRFREHKEAGYNFSPDLNVTHPGMSTVGRPSTITGPMGAGDVSVAGQLMQVAGPRQDFATRDPTQSKTYLDREAQGAQTSRIALARLGEELTLRNEMQGPATVSNRGMTRPDTEGGRQEILNWATALGEAGRAGDELSEMDRLFSGEGLPGEGEGAPLLSSQDEGGGNLLTRTWDAGNDWAARNFGREPASAAIPEARSPVHTTGPAGVSYESARSYMRQSEAQRRTEELIAQGYGPEQIRAVLAREGHITPPAMAPQRARP